MTIALNEVGNVGARAKSLRRGDSGVFHRATASVANDDRPVSDPAPSQVCTGERLRSGVRRATRAEAAAALSTTADRLGVNDSEIGAAIDEPRQRVAEMKTGTRALTMDHVLLMARRLPLFFAAFAGELFGGGQ